MRSFNASTAADLEPVALVLAELSRRADACGVEIMVVGATARDILIRHVVGSVPERATADIDVAVAVSSWSDLRRLTEPFVRRTGSEHKFEVQQAEVDIIPFGAIEDANRTITWPDDHRMNVFGFQEAPENLGFITALLNSAEQFDLLAADMGGLVRENRSLLLAYSRGFG